MESERQIVGDKEVNPYRLKINDYNGRLFDTHTFGRPLKSDIFQSLFSQQTVYLEIGSGSGAHLIERARREPSASWIGIERRFKRAVRTIEKATERGVDQVFVARADVQDVLPVVPENSLDGIYLLFPDPWPKPRHWKNRFFSGDNLKRLAPLIKEGGFFCFKTDHRDYYQWALKELQSQSVFKVIRHSADIYQDRKPEEEIRSEFENLFLSKNEPVAEILLQKEGL